MTRPSRHLSAASTVLHVGLGMFVLLLLAPLAWPAELAPGDFGAWMVALGGLGAVALGGKAGVSAMSAGRHWGEGGRATLGVEIEP